MSDDVAASDGSTERNLFNYSLRATKAVESLPALETTNGTSIALMRRGYQIEYERSFASAAGSR